MWHKIHDSENVSGRLFLIVKTRKIRVFRVFDSSSNSREKLKMSKSVFFVKNDKKQVKNDKNIKNIKFRGSLVKGPLKNTYKTPYRALLPDLAE